MRDLMIGHPYLIGAALAVLVGLGAFNAYRSGYEVGRFAVLDAVEHDAARLASEALGG